jgi:hypothetical protein
MSSNLYSMKYTKEKLEQAIKNARSVSQVLNSLGLLQSGGNHSYITKKIREFGLDISHFLGQGWNRGGSSNKKKKAKDILVLNPVNRIKSKQLTRAMLELGIDYKCVSCGVGNHYNNRPITLHVDHINGDWKDNKIENLRFLCPNCHSQTDTFGSKNQE